MCQPYLIAVLYYWSSTSTRIVNGSMKCLCAVTVTGSEMKGVCLYRTVLVLSCSHFAEVCGSFTVAATVRYIQIPANVGYIVLR